MRQPYSQFVEMLQNAWPEWVIVKELSCTFSEILFAAQKRNVPGKTSTIRFVKYEAVQKYQIEKQYKKLPGDEISPNVSYDDGFLYTLLTTFSLKTGIWYTLVRTEYTGRDAEVNRNAFRITEEAKRNHEKLFYTDGIPVVVDKRKLRAEIIEARQNVEWDWSASWQDEERERRREEREREKEASARIDRELELNRAREEEERRRRQREEEDRRYDEWAEAEERRMRGY